MERQFHLRKPILKRNVESASDSTVGNTRESWIPPNTMPNGSIDSTRNYVAELSNAQRRSWPTLASAHDNAVECRRILHENLRTYINDDHEVIVFGSLARREWTTGSDVDWTLLIDSQANSDHRLVARRIQATLERLSFEGQLLRPPGTEGILGNMAFSHEIVHHIGGQADTNRNTTQRILLLLEATALKSRNDNADGPFERVRRQVLFRYLRSDSNFDAKADDQSRIPRFLLDDIVRYWRTMCVDFTYKEWEQAGIKWALRNVKLRMSRKLLFVAGLLMVFSCFQNQALRRRTDESDHDEYLGRIQSHLLAFVHSTPLNIIAWALAQVNLDSHCVDLLEEYEQFLARINDPEFRAHLAALRQQDVYGDDRFLECREISHRLQAALKSVCFEVDSPLREFTCEYGVF